MNNHPKAEEIAGYFGHEYDSELARDISQALTSVQSDLAKELLERVGEMTEEKWAVENGYSGCCGEEAEGHNAARAKMIELFKEKGIEICP